MIHHRGQDRHGGGVLIQVGKAARMVCGLLRGRRSPARNRNRGRKRRSRRRCEARRWRRRYSKRLLSWAIDKTSRSIYVLRLADIPKPWRRLERAQPSRITIAPGGVYGGRGRMLRRKIHFPEQHLLPFCGKSERFQQKLVGVAVAVELAPSSTSLSKRLF